MQTGKESAIRLLIVDDSVEDAEAIVSGLRNGGIAVRPSRPENADELATMIANQALDLVLASMSASHVELAEVVRQVDASGKDLPVVVLLSQLDNDTVLEALDIGGRNVVLRSRMDHVQNVVRNEFTDLEARRSLRRLEAQLRETERRCDALIASSRDPIAYVHEGMHIRANDAYLEMFGFESFEDIEGMSLLDLVAPAHVDAFKQLLKRLGKGESAPPRHELEARGIDGGTFPAVMEFTAAIYEGEACLQIVFRRQEIDPELAREVEELRQRDQVTGLLNRPTFLHMLEGAVSEAAQGMRKHGLLLIEPDHYQRLLQDIGLDSADRLIAALAARLQEVAGEDAACARFGEHSLAVLLPGSDHTHTAEAAERIREAFAAHVFAVGDRSSGITTSIGGVQIGEKIASVTQVLSKASQGVQSSIGVGGNRVEIFDPGAVDRAEEERIRAWVERIRDAIDNDRFVLHYQPIISLQGDTGATYEAFLRLDAGGGDLVLPMTFLQIAEEHDLLGEIDRWVVGRAIEVIAEQMRAGKPTTLFVKITPASLSNDRMLQLIGKQLAQQKVPGEHLVLELSEAKVFTHLNAAQQFLGDISALGCKIALEQFGSGLNSFQLLSHFKPEYLKIDRAFVQDLGKSADNQRKVAEIAEKSREMGIRVIAEFVEDAGSMAILFSSGVDYVEGHFLAPAGPEMQYEFE